MAGREPLINSGFLRRWYAMAPVGFLAGQAKSVCEPVHEIKQGNDQRCVENFLIAVVV